MSTKSSSGRSSSKWRNFQANYKLVLFFLSGGTILIFLAHFLNALNNGVTTLWQITILSLGSGSLMAGFFNIVYAVKTRENFIKLLADVVPTIAAGITVHPSHAKVLPREDAIAQYLEDGDKVRLCTSTGDNYFKFSEPANVILREKIEKRNCEMHVLLYLPVFERICGSHIGQRSKSPQDLINEHKSLMNDYEEMISLGKGNVVVRFFTVPLHTNIVIYGNKRIYSAPILHFARGRQNLPCYEMYPSGADSLFFKFQNDFDQLFKVTDKRRVLELAEVKALYIEAQHDFNTLCELFHKRYVQMPIEIQNGEAVSAS